MDEMKGSLSVLTMALLMGVNVENPTASMMDRGTP
jgi:hypothetical protein